MKNLLITIVTVALVGCGESKPISSQDRNTIESFYGPISEIEIKIIGYTGHSLEITNHPLKSFNGIYESEPGRINDKYWYKNSNARYLYHYNQAEGGEKSWSLDHRKPDGKKDWFSGGWTRINEGLYPEEGKKDWYSIDQSLIGLLSDNDMVSVEKFIEDGANTNAKLQISAEPIIFITPLDIAIGEGHREIANILRKHGAKTAEELNAEGK